MTKFVVFSVSFAMFLSVSTYSFAQSIAESQQAVKESVKAGSAASKASIHAIAASGQTTSAASAVPLLISGAAGTASGKAGSDLLNTATQPIGQPLQVTDETITVGPPPDQALKAKQPAGN